MTTFSTVTSKQYSIACSALFMYVQLQVLGSGSEVLRGCVEAAGIGLGRNRWGSLQVPLTVNWT